MRTRTLLPVLAGGLLAAAVPALASDPSSGSVSKASPKFEWTGSSNAYGVYPLQDTIGPEFGSDQPCEPPTCDSFALEVADQDTLTLTADNDNTGGPGSDSVEMDVVKPDGEVIYTQSEPDKPVVVKIKNAPKGAYEIRVFVNQPPNVDGAYKASAVLGSGAAAAPAPAPAPGPGGQPAPAPGGEPAPAQPAATLSLKTKSASARKVKKSLKLSIGSSKPVTDVQVSLAKGKKVLGTAKLASMGTSATVKLKLKKKLKKGAYGVTIRAKDGSRDVALTAKLTVKK